MEIIGKNLKIDIAEIEANKNKFLERISVYKSYGFDQVKSRDHRDEGHEHEEEHGFSVKRYEGYCQVVYVALK